MNPTEPLRDTEKNSRPGPRAVLPRFLFIALVLFPVSWTINALLIGSWRVTVGDAESLRHLVEWIVTLALASAFVCWLSFRPWLQRLAGPRAARRVVIAVAWTATLLVLFYAEEDWRAARAWNAYRAQLEADGWKFDFAAFIPKPVPDEQNFAATPVVTSWFAEVNTNVFTNTTERFVKLWQDNYARAAERLKAPDDPGRRHFIDLAAFARAFASEAPSNSIPSDGDHSDAAARAAAVATVLAGLKTNEPALSALRDASARPLARYPVIYETEKPWSTYLPHLINLRDACRRLRLRACAELAAGRSDDALADVKLMLYLADTAKDEPFLISHLVRLACINLAVQPVWEGLAAHAWTDAQLRELEARFGQSNFLADVKYPLESERALGVFTIEVVKQKGGAFFVELIGPGSPSGADKKLANWLSGLVPAGWYRQEQINYCRLGRALTEDVSNTETKRVFPDRVQSSTSAVGQGISGRTFISALFHHRMFVSITSPAIGQVFMRTAETQVAADQAVLACALERFRLAHGQFPETLQALVPETISQAPTDLLSGQAYRYQRTAIDRFVLYSVGWNEKDDGGVPGKTIFDDEQGDWVWSYPAKL
jgi:hypothetical protein